MKILYLIDDLEPQYPRDQNYIFKYMVERGHQVDIVTTRNPESEIYDHIFYRRARIARYPVLGTFKSIKFYAPSPARLVVRYDVIHSFTFYTYSSIIAMLARGRARFIRSEISHLGSRRVRRGLTVFRPLTEAYKRFYHVVTAYNAREVASLKLLGFDEERILLVPPMIDYQLFSRYRRDPGEPLVLGTMARISPEKGIEAVPEILRALRSSTRRRFRYILAGRIQDRAYANAVVEKLRRELGEDFKYLGELKSPGEFYRSVDIVIYPTTIETGAISVLEAMASGKVVIAARVHPIDLYIVDGVSGYLFTKAEEAAEKLTLVIEDPGRLRELQQEASKYAEKHDYRAICSTLEKSYLEASESGDK